MSSHFYEVALYGEFFSKDLKAILNRLTLHSESSQATHVVEVVFEPVEAQYVRIAEPVLLRAKKELTDPDGTWTLYSYLKPEPVRAHPEATVRPWAIIYVSGDALSFASALGYEQRSKIFKRGYAFRKGSLVIQMFQQEQIDPKTQQPITAHADTLWEMEVKTANPMRNTQETPLQQAVDAVVEVQVLMKGLLDLRRQDL